MITGRTTGGRTHRHRQPLHIWPLDQQYFVEVINERLRLSLFRGKDVHVKLWIICAVWTTNWTTVSQKKRFYQCLQMRRILFGRLFFCCNFVTIRNHICSLVTLRKISCSHRTIDGQWLWNHAIKSPEIGLRQGMLSLEPALFVYFLIKTLLQMNVCGMQKLCQRQMSLVLVVTVRFKVTWAHMILHWTKERSSSSKVTTLFHLLAYLLHLCCSSTPGVFLNAVS